MSEFLMKQFRRAPGGLILEDGHLFEGRALSPAAQTTAPIYAPLMVDRSMTGFQESVSDPAHHGALLVFTCPHVGNTGDNAADRQSERARPAGLVVREFSAVASDWRAEQSWPAWMAQEGWPGLEGVDTRALAQHLREAGPQWGALFFGEADRAAILAELRRRAHTTPLDRLADLTRSAPYDVPAAHRGAALSLAVYDLGVRRDLLDTLTAQGAQLRVWPARTPAQQLLESDARGVILSGGPEDAAPEALLDAVRALIGRRPLYAVGRGFLLLAQALGAECAPLARAQRGDNLPVRCLATGRVFTTRQSYGWGVRPFGAGAQWAAGSAQASHVNLNDGQLAGLIDVQRGLYGSLFAPRAQGPQGALFQQFLESARVQK